MVTLTTKRFVFVFLLFATNIFGGSIFAKDTKIMQEGSSFRLMSSSHEVVINSEGRIAAINIMGKEVVSSGHFYQGGIPKMFASKTGDNIVEASGDKCTVKFVFDENSIDLELSNQTAQLMQYAIVFSPGIAAVKDEKGDYYKTPVNANWNISNWYRDNGKLSVNGSNVKLWGPYDGNRQVWVTDIDSKGKSKINLKVSQAQTDEIAKTLTAPTYQANKTVKASNEKPAWNMNLLEKAPNVYQADGFGIDNGKAIFYEGLTYKGKNTRVFAWLGMPKVPKGEKVPAVVLVHGGGGTAFSDWVKLWNSRGYAAIAMDTTGCVPRGAFPKWERHQWAGPLGWDNSFKDTESPLTDQWTYHAIANIVLANSLLRSMPEIDADKIGLIGISWGGYLSCIAAAVDKRFCFAVSVYGCGYLLETYFEPSLMSQGRERAEKWVNNWDPANYLKEARLPFLWVNGSNDFAYPLNAWQKSYQLPKGERTVCAILRMRHGHGGPGENPEEISVFANTYCKGGLPLLKITSEGTDGDYAWVEFKTSVPVKKAELNFTCDTGNWSKRKWETTSAELRASNKVAALIPKGSTAYYFNIFDERNCIVSSEHKEMKTK